MNASALLIAARAKIDAPEKWIKGDYAHDDEGQSVPQATLPGRAVCFCSLGALFGVDPKLPTSFVYHSHVAYLARAAAKLAPNNEVISRLFRNLSYGGVVFHFNDLEETTHADVMKMFDLAIQAAKADEAAEATQ